VAVTDPAPPRVRKLAPSRLSTPVRSLALRAHAARSYDAGRVEGPSEHAKRRHLLELFRERGHRTFVESGTYRGDTTAFFVPHADRLITVEVDRRLYQQARDRFGREPKVEVVEGDALVEVPRIVAELDVPALVWLDGHYSGGDTGRGVEVEPALAILDRIGDAAPAGSTIVVDDLRLFGRLPDFPRLEDLIGTAHKAFPRAALRTGLDSLVIAA
jgi:hypothetical protein